MKRLTTVLLVLFVVLAGGCVGTSSNGTEKASQQYITVTDSLGRTVQVPVNVQKVVAIGPGALRLIVYLNASDMVVGVEDFEKKYSYGRPYIIAHPELKNLPSIGPGGPGKLPNLEALTNVSPDVIIAVFISKEQADEIQEKTGIPVVVLSYGARGGGMKGFNDPRLIESIQLAGKILHREERAKELINFFNSVQEDLQKRVKGEKSPRVYVGGIGYKGAHGIESTYGDYAPFEVLNLTNIAASLGPGWKTVDKEWLLKEDPDYLFIDEGGLKIILDDYRKNPDFYRALSALKEGRVYGLLPFNFYNTNLGTAIADTYYIGKVLYPEHFSDVDPVKKADEIYAFLVGKPVYETLKEQFGGFGKIDFENGTVKYSLPTSP
ncbi:ABC transporter substrate-binding protein [Thermococcus sp. JCM 11816]|uniref:iron ABC transporter substrate-binding protein n=1 Tax=Thermococcus sp. (strain JCM 11816 / KS-1) TaxID=1295125 RepID=UPI0006CFBF2B